MRQWRRSTVYSVLALAVLGCQADLGEPLHVVTARDLSGTYTGVLEGVTVGSLDELDDPQGRVIVDLDLLHELTIRNVGDLTLKIQSAVIPPLRAIVLGFGTVAINAEFLEFEDLDFSGGDLQFGALKVKQIVFVQYEGEWVVVLQVVRVGMAEQGAPDDVYVYQYVSYPSQVAGRMSDDEAIRYVNIILRLVSAAQRL